MRHDTPKRALKLICIWLLVIHSVNTSTPAYAVEIKDIDKYKIYIHLKVISDKSYRCISTLWSLENRSWDPYAKNPKSSAFGIPQLLKLKETNPYVQMDLGYKYIIHRYSNKGKDIANAPCNALAFHKKNRYY